MDERLGPDMQKRIYRSLVVGPRILIGVQFAIILILIVLLVR